jgi:hypothetical protein
MSLDSLPSAWSTGNEFGDCPVSAYGTGRLNARADDAQEGMSAFLEKRPPAWRGQ